MSLAQKNRIKAHSKSAQSYIIGVDEVGRGPIAGPITFCIFVMKREVDILSLFDKRKLRDSKKLTPKKREEIYKKLSNMKKESLVDYCLVSHSARQIDTLGLSRIVRKSIDTGLEKIAKKIPLHNTYIYLDGGLTIKDATLQFETVIKGDEKVEAIACASIIAKVTRDMYMHKLEQKLKKEKGVEYGWSRNVGYGTREHYEYMKKYGIHEHHRKSFLKNFVLD